MADYIISPSDGDTSGEEEFSRILYTNNETIVEDVDETSNSCNSDYTQFVSVSFTTATTQQKCMYLFTLSEFLPNIFYLFITLQI